MTYHQTATSRPRSPRVWRAPGLGQATSTPDMVFSLTDPDVAAMQAPTTTTSTTPSTTASSGGKAPATTSLFPSASSGGKTGGSAPITSAVYSAAPSATDSGTPHWVPWAIGGTVAVLGIGLIFAARG